MAITLDATLKTAQDGVNHRPIAELVSSPMGEIIPTSGNYFNTLSNTEREPHIISLSTGRLACIMERVGTYTELYYLYTPTDRSEWIEVHISTLSPPNGSDPCLCELTNGNIGIIFKGSGDLYYKIITPTGAIVVDSTLIYDPGTNWIANPYVIKLANDTYLLVYPEGTGTPPSESNTYYLQKRTSSNFTSWSSATDIRPSEFATVRYCNNPHMEQVTSGRIFLWVDYLNQYTNEVELNNIYMIYSDDNGATWSSAEKITNFTNLGHSATHPTATEQTDGDITFMYAEKSLVKSLNVDMTGYPYTVFGPSFFNFDDDTNELHVVHSIYGLGPEPHKGITTIDTNAWEWQETIDETTIPALDLIDGAFNPFKSDCEWSAGKIHYGRIQSYNHITQTTRTYGWGYAIGSPYAHSNYVLPGYDCGLAALDVQSGIIAEHDGIQKMFIYHECSGYSQFYNSLGWINLNEVEDPITGAYTYYTIFEDRSTGMNLCGGTLHGGWIQWDPIRAYIMTYTWDEDPDVYYATNPGIYVVNPDSGAEILKLNNEDVQGFPRTGTRSCVYMENDIYFSFPYWSNEPDKRGLAKYTVATGTVTFFPPNWATVNDYELKCLTDMGDGRILMVSNNTLANGGGVCIFDTNTDTWERVFNDDTYPGFSRTSASWDDVAYDPSTNTIFAIFASEVIAFSEYGPYSLLQYTDIDNVDSTIDYGDYITFSYYFFEYQPNIVYDEVGVLWAVWQHVQDGSEYSVVWANLLDDLNITNDVSHAPISIQWDVQKPNKLTFSLSKGHLYDPQNFMSTLSPFLRKGRKIVVKFGETVGATDYLQAQGEFCVKSVALQYKVEGYPEAKVVAEDFRVLWEDTEVVATMYYEDQTPYNVLENVLIQHGSMIASELNIPDPWVDEHNLYHQFVEMDLDDIVKELLDHFGYFPFVNVDGEFEPRYVNLAKATDHIYSNTVSLVKYTPNDSYSTFINRIIVKGISHVYSEVLYEEENITSISGTTGWWGRDRDEAVWYSDDHQRTCRYPRLEIIQSVTEFQIFGIRTGGGTEYISAVDDDEHYVVITIEAPDLTGVFIGVVAAIVALGISAVACDGFLTGWCGWVIFGLCMLLNVLLYILGAVASYNYNIWARPIGHEKSTFQAQADDTEFQTELGNKIVPVSIDDPMAYTIAICQQVADHEMGVVKAQRRRLKFEKTFHLQDEIGDVLELIHPYSDEVLKIFVASLKRTMKHGKECIDEIEGWRIV